MIPISLSLRNFLSYRDAAELDLRGLRLACISGLNGAGKSTLLDGITWALFGKSRVKSDDDIVNLTTGPGSAAEVAFVFELEGAIYRIIRRKSPGKTTELEFHARAIDAAGDERWQVKTEARMKETQAEIEKLLRMNYDVFTNASFLLQGRADEFTTKSPDKRKEILAEILGVSRWDDYKELATERRKLVEGEASLIERQLTDVEAELAREEEFRRALEAAEVRVKIADAERERQEALVAVARQNKAQADQQREALRRIAIDLGESGRELQRVEAMLAQRRAELATYQNLLDRRSQIEVAFRDWRVADAEYAAWQEKAERHAAILREMHPLEMTIARAETELQQRLKVLEGRGEQAAKAAGELETLQTTLADRKAQLAGVQQRAAELAGEERAWRDARDQLQQIIYDRKLMEQEYSQLQSRLAQADVWEKDRAQLEESQHTARTSLDTALKALAVLNEQRQVLADKHREKAGIEAEQSRLREEMDEVKAKIEQLEGDESRDCPLCGQTLTPDHRETVLLELRTQGTNRGALFRRNKAAMTGLDEEIQTLEKALLQQTALEKARDTQQAAVTRVDTQVQELDKQLASWRDGAERERLATIRAKLDDVAAERELSAKVESFKSAVEESKRLAGQQKEIESLIVRDETHGEVLARLQEEWQQTGQQALDETRRQLSEEAFVPVERATLTALQERLSAVAYDEAGHSAARARREQLVAAPQEHQELARADAAVKPLEDNLAELDRQRAGVTTRLESLRQDNEAGAQRLQELEAGVADLDAAEAELVRLREAAIAAQRLVGAANQQVAVLATRQEDRKSLSAQRTTLARRIVLLRQLEEACGRKGVQALLIESALPEIEDYANELLDKLTSGEMRVRFETQRTAKSKQDSFIETLDIEISDNAGTRPYENYSGGEKFRVNFAIRLALSQVLARRAGARLRTLVIDEGFGSQDPDGRQKLVEAINTVQEEFACILVITHIDELRDKFPARIDVEKTPSGSRLSLVTI